MTGKKDYAFTLPVLFFLLAGSFLLNGQLLNNVFLSDDYDSLYRLIIEKRIIYREFLRPMIDVSFFLNYCLSGLSAGSYYAFNIAVHGFNAWLIFRLAGQLNMVKPADRPWFSLAAAGLFLVYPFHQESIAWLSGRLSSLACMFALIALLHETSNNRRGQTAIAVGSYLVGLLCYESILLLPFIVLVLKWQHRHTRPLKVNSFLCWFGAMMVYLLARVGMTGQLTGTYGSRLTDTGLLRYASSGLKVFARLFLPPSGNQSFLIVLTVLLVSVLAVLVLLVFKRRRELKGAADCMGMAVCLLISLLLVMAFGVSTHTTEGDRLLYFPSCFVCLMTAWLVVSLLNRPGSRRLVTAVLAVVSLLLLEANNSHWEKSSTAAASILQAAAQNRQAKKIFINLPDEIAGAFVFRNGFTRALVVRGLDTSRVAVVNHLEWTDQLRSAPVIQPRQEGDSLFIFPVTSIVQRQGIILIRNQQNSDIFTVESRQDRLYYWNGTALLPLALPWYRR